MSSFYATFADILFAFPEALQCPWLPEAQLLPEYETEVESDRVDEQPFKNLLMASQVRSPHAAGVVKVGEVAFDQFAPFPADAFAPVYGGLLIAFALPFSPTALGFGNAGPQVVLFPFEKADQVHPRVYSQ